MDMRDALDLIETNTQYRDPLFPDRIQRWGFATERDAVRDAREEIANAHQSERRRGVPPSANESAPPQHSVRLPADTPVIADGLVKLSLADFFEANEVPDEEQREIMSSLAKHGSYLGGGGAQAEYELRLA